MTTKFIKNTLSRSLNLSLVKAIRDELNTISALSKRYHETQYNCTIKSFK